MRKTKEQVLEEYMWGRKIDGQKLKTNDCMKKVIDEFKIRRIGPQKKQELIKLIIRVRNRIKKRFCVYQANIRSYENKGLCVPGLLERWAAAGLVNIESQRASATDIRKFVERDYALAHGLTSEEVPKDPAVPIHHKR